MAFDLLLAGHQWVYTPLCLSRTDCKLFREVGKFVSLSSSQGRKEGYPPRMNGFVLVDMRSGHCIFSMLLREGFGLPSMQSNTNTDETTMAAHLSGMSFSLMLRALSLSGDDSEDVGGPAAAREAFFAELRQRPSLVWERCANAAPITQAQTAEGHALCFFLHPYLPLLCTASTPSDAMSVGARVAEGIVQLFIAGDHAEQYFANGPVGPKKMRKALSAPVKEMFQNILLREIESDCHQQLVGNGGGPTGEWELTVALDPLGNGFDGGILSCTLHGEGPHWPISGAAGSGADDEQSGADEAHRRRCRKRGRRSSQPASSSGTEVVLSPTSDDARHNRLQQLLSTAVLLCTGAAQGTPRSSVAHEPNGSVTVVLCDGTLAAMLSVAPAKPTAPIPSDAAALHCSWAHAQFALWSNMFRFAAAHRLRMFYVL